MNLSDLLNLGIAARLDTDGGLLLDAPKGALSAELLDRIRHAKPELLAELLSGREHGEHGEHGFICTNPAGKGDTLPDELHTHRPPARLTERSEKRQVSHLQNHQNPPSVEAAPCKGGFVGFDGSTSGTFQNISARSWLLHYPDRDPVLIAWSAPVTHAEALADYPDAVAAEPVAHRPPARRPPTEDERIELLALVQAVYATDTDQDRHEAVQMALADPEGALMCYRAIAAERGLKIEQPQRQPHGN